MDIIKLPELPETVVEGIVAVKSEDLKIIVDAINDLSRAVLALNTAVGINQTQIEQCQTDISKIAKILEDMYET